MKKKERLILVKGGGPKTTKVRCVDCKQECRLHDVAEITNTENQTIAFMCMPCVVKHW